MTAAAARELLSSRPAVEVLAASKWFGDKVAVSDLSFALGPGVTTLLGPNGAGKTTTLKMLTGLLRPSRGTVRVLGEPVFNNPSLYRRIGVVPEGDNLYPFLSVQEFVELAARLNHLPRPSEAAEDAIRTVDLLADQNRRLAVVSKGMRQRAKVAQALVHDPQVLFLDEPLSGADPQQRLALMEVFMALGARGKTVLFSSHILHEAERMGSNILVIVDGKLAARGDYHAIRAQMFDHPVRVRITCSEPRAVAAALVALPGTQSVAISGSSLVVQSSDALDLYHAVPRVAQASGVRVYGIEGLDEDLESVFRYLVS